MYKISFFILFIVAKVQGTTFCNINNSSEILTLLKKNHPAIIQNNAYLDFVKQETLTAKKRPNPELEGQTSVGESLGKVIYSTSLSLKHVFELGGKRQARINVAERKIEVESEESRNKNEDILIKAIIKLHRLRQLYELISLYKEALNTFKEIRKSFVKRKYLSPEQQVEKETLGIAISDYQLKISKLDSEKINLNRHLSFFIGKECQIPRKALPRRILENKKIKGKEKNTYSSLAVAQKKLELAKLNYKKEKAEAFSNLLIGPSYKFQKENVSSSHTAGIAFAINLPILNTNEGRKRQAIKRIHKAEIAFRNAKKESQIDLKTWKTKYNNFIKSLKEIVSRGELEKKHHKIEALFKRGIISTSLVIESHRQLLSFYAGRFEFEIGAVEALWNIYKINGEFYNNQL